MLTSPMAGKSIQHSCEPPYTNSSLSLHYCSFGFLQMSLSINVHKKQSDNVAAKYYASRFFFVSTPMSLDF